MMNKSNMELDLISRQDAIRIVDNIDTWQAGWRGNAIESMNALPSAHPEPCEDAVSRKAVEEMLKNGFPARGMWEIEGDVVKQTVCETLADALMDLERLPSAQPEIIRCKDCKYYTRPWYCEAWNNSPGFPVVSDEMFCSMAERREDG